MKKISIFLIAIILSLGVAVRFIPGVTGNHNKSTLSDQIKSPWKKYKNKTLGFSVHYPGDYTVNDSYVYTRLGEGKEVSGVSFTIPASFAEGTNLSNETYISIERISNAGGCTARNFLSYAEKDTTVTENGVTYSLVTSMDAGMGNYYEETVYALSPGNYCYGIRLFIHSTNIGNYDPGTIKEFDRNALMDIFAKMRQTFKVL